MPQQDTLPAGLEEHKATCKFCRVPLTLMIDPAGFEMFTPDIWFSWATCNRCADFRDQVGKYREALYDISAQWLRACVSGNASRAKAEPAIRAGVTAVTKRLMTAICGFYHVQNIWSDELVSNFFAAPHRSKALVDETIRAVKRFAEQRTVDARHEADSRDSYQHVHDENV